MVAYHIKIGPTTAHQHPFEEQFRLAQIGVGGVGTIQQQTAEPDNGFRSTSGSTV